VRLEMSRGTDIVGIVGLWGIKTADSVAETALNVLSLPRTYGFK
jgi:hypothetical protein